MERPGPTGRFHMDQTADKCFHCRKQRVMSANDPTEDAAINRHHTSEFWFCSYECYKKVLEPYVDKIAAPYMEPGDDPIFRIKTTGRYYEDTKYDAEKDKDVKVQKYWPGPDGEEVVQILREWCATYEPHFDKARKILNERLLALQNQQKTAIIDKARQARQEEEKRLDELRRKL